MFLLLRSVDISAVISVLASVSVFSVLVASAIALTEEVLVGPYKWSRVLRHVGCQLSLPQAILIRIGSLPIRAILPLKTGEAAPALYLHKHHDLPLDVASGTILFEKGVNVWATVFLLSLGLALTGFWLAFAAAILWSIVPFVRGPVRRLASVLASGGRVGGFLSGLLKAFVLLPKRELAVQLPLAVLFTGLEVVNFWWILAVLGVEVGFGVVCLVIPLSYFVNNIPVTVLGIGMREGLILVLLGGVADSEVLLAAGILVTLFEYLLPLGVGFVLFPRFLSGLRGRT